MTTEPTHLPNDSMAFGDIAHWWSKVAKDHPGVMLKALTRSFWRGDFESGDQSVVFSLREPGVLHANAYSLSQANEWCGEPREGITPDLLVKVVDGVRESLLSKRQMFRREVVAWTAKEFRLTPLSSGCKRGQPPHREKVSSAKASSLKGISPELADLRSSSSFQFVTIPFDEWPPDKKERIYCGWCIRRGDFAEWFRTTPLSAGVRLEAFWPLSAGAADDPVTSISDDAGTRNAAKKLSRAFAMIKEAVDQELASDVRLDLLRPGQRYRRLADRMTSMGIKPSEIPNIRTVRKFFNEGPGKTEKSG